MGKTVPALLKDIAAIKNSDELSESQKALVLSGLRKQLDEAAGQTNLTLTGGGAISPPSDDSPKGAKR